MTLLAFAFALMLATGIFGGVLAALHLRSRAMPRPPWMFGALHGIVAIAGCIILLLSLGGPPRGVEMGVASFGRISAVLFGLALLAGLVIPLIRPRLRQIPGVVIGVHATIAISGIVVLAAYTLLG